MTKTIKRSGGLSATLLAVWAGLSASSAHASLLGDTVDVTLLPFLTFISDSGTGSTQSVTVTADEEGSFFGSQFFDLGDSTFSIRSSSEFSGGMFGNLGGQAAIVLTSLDLGAPITDVQFTSLLTGLQVHFSATEVTFSWRDNQPIPFNTYISAQFITSAPVPVPTPALLLASAIGTLGLSRRLSERTKRA